MYQSGQWFLKDKHGHDMKFTQAAIRFDGGLFIFLILSNPSSSKKLVIFKDQIKSEDQRRLTLLMLCPRKREHA